MKEKLFNKGVERARNFLSANKITPPEFHNERTLPKKFAYLSKARTCGLYRNGVVFVNVRKTATPALKPGFRWSYPGYKVDRTAYGVVAHEVGHHIWRTLNVKPAAWLAVLAATTKHVSGYEPNLEEAFAETIKLFITNPDMLRRGLPERYAFLTNVLNLRPLDDQSFDKVLKLKVYVAAARRWIGRSTPRPKAPTYFEWEGHDRIVAVARRKFTDSSLWKLEGKHVRLKPNVEENWPEEFGIVVEVEPAVKPEDAMMIVEVDRKYRDRDDDGIREVGVEQVELIQ